jgi:hypothetical protein
MGSNRHNDTSTIDGASALTAYHPTWQRPAIESFEKSIAAHGGWDTWETLQPIQLKLTKFEGLLPFLKGLGKTFQSPLEMKIDSRRRIVEFNYDSHIDTFNNGHLIYSPEKKEIPDGRTIFKKEVLEKWFPQHSLYFFGYAWANYIGYPFILPQFELLQWEVGAKYSRFKIRFPENFHTHSRVQTFYFDSSHLLYRHDYHADYAGSIFYGAHYCSRYYMKNKLPVALLREVRPRLGSAILPGYGIYAELEF